MIRRFFALLMIIMLLCTSAQAGMYTGTALGGTSSACSHSWKLVKVTKEASCGKAGSAKYKCTKCGKTKTRKIARLAHSFGEWTVIREATCKKKGSVSMTCAVCGKKLTFTLPKGLHTVAEWTVIKEPSGHNPGKHKGKCSVCGKTVTESWYPDGVIWAYSDAALIRELQTELYRLGFYTGEITGIYDKTLLKAIKKFQKKYKLTGDGVLWEDSLSVLGINQAPGTPITEQNLSGYTLQLTVEQVTQPKASYAPGDTILFKWTVENKAKKDAKTPALYLYTTLTPDADTDLMLDENELLQKKGSLSGTFEYTVAQDETRIGFVIRAKIGSKTYTSNTVQFKLKIDGE